MSAPTWAQDPPDIPTLDDSVIVPSSANIGNVAAFPMADINRNLFITNWQQSNWTGREQSVGVIDVGFGGLLTFESTFGITVMIPELTKDAYDASSIRHGTEVLEVVQSVAPDVNLFACSYGDFTTFRSCIDWMISNNVRIINHSVGVPALPLDGQGEWALEVDRAAREGILWVNAAGNFAGGYIDDQFSYYPATPYNAFSDARGNFGQALSMPAVGDNVFGRIMLSWEGREAGVDGTPEVAANTIDLDIEIHFADGTVLSSSGRQTGGVVDRAIEVVNVNMSQPFGIQIRDNTSSIQAVTAGGAGGISFVLFVEFAALPGGQLQQSIIAPGDSVNSLTVGALQNGVIAPYSSRGPIATGAIKPNLVAPGEIRLNDGTDFVGTSAAAPVVAGVAALLWQANPTWTREQLFEFMNSDTILRDDSVVPGPDGNYGNGYMSLPAQIPQQSVVAEQAGSSEVISLPYLRDFDEAGNPLTNWTYDPAAWQAVRVGGDIVLVGQGNIDQPIVVEGDSTAIWTDPNVTDDLVISYEFNLEAGSGGLRLVFRYSETAGYNAIEVFPGRIFIKRNNIDTIDVLNRENEIMLASVPASINEDTWHRLRIWISTNQIYIYLDNLLVATAEDSYFPTLTAGDIMFQANQPLREVRVNNFSILTAQRASDHFENSSLPPTWETSDTVSTTIEQEDDNQYVALNGELTLTPSMPEITDLRLSCRIWTEQGTYRLRLRSTDDGSLLFTFEGGNLTVQQVDDFGDPEWETVIENFYNRRHWDDITISYIGTTLQIYRDGELRFSGNVAARRELGPGVVVFDTDDNAIIRLDDCLITEVLPGTG